MTVHISQEAREAMAQCLFENETETLSRLYKKLQQMRRDEAELVTRINECVMTRAMLLRSFIPGKSA